MAVMRAEPLAATPTAAVLRACSSVGAAARLGLYVMVHPIEGQYAIKEAAPWAAVPLFLLLAVLVRLASIAWSSFQFSEIDPEDASLALEIFRVLAPWATWCIAGYGVSSIAYGEGTFRQIAVSSACALVPYVVFTPALVVVVSHALSLDEAALYGLLSFAIQCWVAWLFFCQVWVLHNFTFRRAIGVSALTLVGMLVIWAMLALVFLLTNQMVQFFSDVLYEFTTRA